MHNLPLLETVAVALAYALVGGVLARRLGLPTIVGYLIAGVALGPFTPGYSGDLATINQLAELGVILLMFGVGLHFSLRDLWQVRGIALPTALIRMAVIAWVGQWMTAPWGWSATSSWLFGAGLAVSSTVVLLRNLMDEGLLQTPAGRSAVGGLIVEDLAAVLLLVLLPAAVAGAQGDGAGGGLPSWHPVLMAVAKAAAFLAVMFVAGTRVIPALLNRVAATRSRELFVLVALTAAVGTALGAAEFFGVSLALGAFIAGLVVSESPFSHQVSADLLPFREAFAVLFFVSVGMLVNPAYLAGHWPAVLAVSALVVLGKAVISAGIVACLPYPARTALTLGAGASQIGEFSFIIGQSGMALGLLSAEQYSLLLAGAIVSITVNPAMFKLVGPAERGLRRWPAVWRFVDRHGVLPPKKPSAMRDHVVIIGSGRVGRHIADLLGAQGVPRLVVESDPAVLSRLQALRVPTLYGDAANSEVLRHAGLEHARILVITIPDLASTLATVATARSCARHLPIIARASTWAGGRQLLSHGVTEIVRPELEGGAEMVRRTLISLDVSAEVTQQLVADLKVRDELLSS